ncbi:MAG: ATP-binding protein [Saprospiraceae bacterium]
MFLLFPWLLWPQEIDTAAINRLFQHAQIIHEDSAAEAQQICLEVIERSKQANYLKAQGDAYIILGAISRNRKNFPESYHYLRRSLEIRRAIGDSNRVAAVFINLGINLLEESKYDSAIAVVSYAIKIVEELSNPAYDVLGSEYLLLSNIFDEYLEPEDALKYARKSLSAYEKSNQTVLIGKASYTLANRFISLGLQDSALIYYDKAFGFFQNRSLDPGIVSEILINKGIIYMQKGDFAPSKLMYEEAQKTLVQMGENADWFHFYLNKGELFMAQNDWKGGLDLLEKALPEDVTELDFYDRLYLFENLSNAYAQLQKYDSAHYYQQAAYAVRDSIYNENKRKEFVRFQTERYRRETAQQALETQQEASRARLFLQSSLLLLLVALLIAYAYFQRKKTFNLIQKQQETQHQQEVDELIQNSEMRYLSAGLEGRELEKEQIARELHDQLGSSLVTLSWQYDAVLENTDRNSGNYDAMLQLNDSLRRLYQDIRQIAHQLGSGVLERAGLIPVLDELCKTIQAGDRIEVSFSHFGLENRLGFNYEINILRIIQELISNVLKYAKATQLMVQINRIGEDLNIMVEDNGVGFEQKKALQRSGAGLQNIEARLRSLNGTLQFENRPMGGTTVIINIPMPKPETFYEQTH